MRKVSFALCAGACALAAALPARADDDKCHLLAPDILCAYDDDFDFANAKFSLFSPDHCEAAVVYWTKDYAQIDMRIDEAGHIVVPVTLDGKVIKFTFDAGAGRFDLDWDTAKDLFGTDEHSPGAAGDLAYYVAERPKDAYGAPWLEMVRARAGQLDPAVRDARHYDDDWRAPNARAIISNMAMPKRNWSA